MEVHSQSEQNKSTNSLPKKKKNVKNNDRSHPHSQKSITAHDA